MNITTSLRLRNKLSERIRPPRFLTSLRRLARLCSKSAALRMLGMAKIPSLRRRLLRNRSSRAKAAKNQRSSRRLPKPKRTSQPYSKIQNLPRKMIKPFMSKNKRMTRRKRMRPNRRRSQWQKRMTMRAKPSHRSSSYTEQKANRSSRTSWKSKNRRRRNWLQN